MEVLPVLAPMYRREKHATIYDVCDVILLFNYK